jgi:GT2 family glycosyltransferase
VRRTGLSTIVGVLAPGLSVLPQLLDRLASVFAMFSDGVRRVRYRRGDLRRLPATEMVSDRPSLDEGIQWMPRVRLGGRSHVALMCCPNSHAAYDVTLPENATVVSSYGLAPEVWDQNVGRVEFEIRVRTQGLESAARRVLDPRRRRDRRWKTLRVRAVEAGPARIVLSTRMVADGPADRATALWGDPCVQAPRSAASFVSALQATLSNWGFRGLWHRTLGKSDGLYSLWVRESTPSRRALLAQRQWSLPRTKTYSLVTFVAEPGGWPSQRTARTVLGQSYPHWEWLLVATEESIDRAGEMVGRLKRDQRVRILNIQSQSTRAEAWNAAWREAHGEFAALLDQHDALSPSAIYEMASALDRTPDSDMLYSDEDRISGPGSLRREPHFKPDWSPDLLLAYNYIGRMTMIRVRAATAVGGFRNGYEGAEEWDLFLRLSAVAARIRRVPRCLYHREKTDVENRGGQEEAAIRDHCAQLGLNVAVSKSVCGYRVVWPVHRRPTVSVVIPNRDAAKVITQCVSGLLRGTSYPRLELVIVDNGSTEPEVLELYRSLERDRCGVIVRFDSPFNFSAACNAGAAVASGDLLLFLNNDIEIIEPDWLDELVRWSLLPDVGIVGAKLLYPDRTIQHAGVVFGLGLVGHIFSRALDGTSGLFGSSESYRNYLAVTGACQMMRREVFERLGRYDERFRLSFSDVMLCMQAWKSGYRVMFTPYARLIHHESYTRKRDDWPQDLELLVRYLETSGFVEDPYFHPELNPKSAVPELRPPLDPTPRQVVRDYIERVRSTAEMAGR